MTFDFDPDAAPSAASTPTGDSAMRTEHADVLWRDRIRAVVASRVIPDLAARHGDEKPDMSLDERAAALAGLAVAGSPEAVVDLTESWLTEGIELEAVILQLTARAARHLGELWLADRLSFLDVTRGTAVLGRVLRRYAPAFEARSDGGSNGRSILLAPVPGEQHVLGLSMLATVFRRDGWHVAFEPHIGADALVNRLQADQFDAVGLSAGGMRSLRRLPALIERIRAACGDAAPCVLVGGPGLPEDARPNDFGADIVAHDAVTAVRLANACRWGKQRPAVRLDLGCERALDLQQLLS